MHDDVGGIDARHLGDEGQEPVPEREGVPGWSPPSGNSFALSRERSSNARSFWTRARWKKPSPPTFPATEQETEHRARREHPPAARDRHVPAASPERHRERREAREEHERECQVERRKANVTARAANTSTSDHATAAGTPDAEGPRDDHARREDDTEADDEPQAEPDTVHGAATLPRSDGGCGLQLVSNDSTSPEPSQAAASR